MIFESIRQHLGSMNFALTATNGNGICILKNRAGERGIFCVIMDSSRSLPWSSGQIVSINSQLHSLAQDGLSGFNDVLFIVITADTPRDRYLAQLDGVSLWLVDSSSGELLIYENQPSDFYGLRAGIEAAALRGAGYTDVGTDFAKEASTRSKRYFPFVTASIIFINVAVYIITAALGSLSSPSYMYRVGANYGFAVFEDFEIWRLVTSMFLHFSLSHLMSNMIYLGILGYQLEQALGRWKYLLLYFLSGIGASLVSSAYYYFTGTHTISAGASGAIYGLIGIFVYLTILTARRMRSGSLFLRIGIGLIFIFYSSFYGTAVDGAAHVGGFFFGFLLAVLFIKPGQRKKIN